MKKILAFGASTSTTSINHKLATYAANQLDQFQAMVINLSDFEMPIFSIDREKAHGVPDLAKSFKDKIREADGIIISFAEHNGSYSAAFKNVFDWASRVEKNMWLDKPMILLATSPGGRGGQTVLQAAVNHFPYMGGLVEGSFSLPSFHANFDANEGITDSELKKAFEIQLNLFSKALGD